MVNISAVIIAGLVAAVVFSIFTALARAMGMTKMSIEKTLGAMVGEGPGADAAGWIMHLSSGIVFAVIYAFIIEVIGVTNGWLIGGIIGLGHGLVTGGIVMPMMSFIHPAVAQGRIKAPGFFAHNAGPMTPMGLILGHIVFGAVLGSVYLLIAL